MTRAPELALRSTLWIAGFGLMASTAWSQVPAVADGVLREAWVDPNSGSDLQRESSARAPFRTVTRALNEFVSFDQHFGRPILCDTDGDGDRDLLMVRTSVGVRAYENFGSEFLPCYALRGWVTSAVNTETECFAFDFDGDGDQDLGFIGLSIAQPRELHFYPSLGGWPPRFGAPVIVPEAGGGDTRIVGDNSQVSVGDVDGDGLWDLIYFKPELHHSNGCGTPGRVLRAHWRRNVGTRGTPVMSLESPLYTLGGQVAYPSCEMGSSMLVDLDGDGDLDWLFSPGEEVLYCENRPGQGLTAPSLMAGLNSTRAADPRFMLMNGQGSERWIVFRVGSNLWVSSYDTTIAYFARKVLRGSAPSTSLTLGEPVPWALLGEPAAAPARVVVHLAPGIYSETSGESFPWNGFQGVELRGVVGVVVDAGVQNVIHTSTTARFSYPGFPVWGTGRLVLRDLELRTQGDAVYAHLHSDLELERVVLRAGGAGVLLGLRTLPRTDPFSTARFEDCIFRGCTVAIDPGARSLWRSVIARRCTFENNGVGLFASDRREHLLEHCRFVGNQRAILAQAWRTCPSGSCAPAELLRFDIHGCHFADNVEHLALVSAYQSSTNLSAELWHNTIVGGGLAFATALTGAEPGDLRVRNSAIFPGGGITSGTFLRLDIGASAVADPALALQNGNTGAMPDFAISPREGHQSSRSAWRDAATLAPPPMASHDADGDRRGSGGRADLGADEVRLPVVIGEPIALRGRSYRYGIAGEGPGVALLLVAPELSAPTWLFGTPLYLDVSAWTTLVLPVALDARGVGMVDLGLPPAAVLPLAELHAQAIVASNGSAPQLTRLRQLRLL
jgi:hypothetical protein